MTVSVYTSNSREKLRKFKTLKKSWKHDGFGFHFDFTRKITNIQNTKKIVNTWRFSTTWLLSTSISREKSRIFKTQNKIAKTRIICITLLFSTSISREKLQKFEILKKVVKTLSQYLTIIRFEITGKITEFSKT